MANFHNPALGNRGSGWSTRTTPTRWARSPAATWRARARYDHLPFFYSDLFDLGYEAVGDLDARLETMADWKEQFREGVVYYLEGGACAACCSGTPGTRWTPPAR